MENSNYNIYLETTKGLITIPCGKIENIDKFTIRFDNRLVFLSVIVEMLQLDISIKDIGKIYISNRTENEIKTYGFNIENCFPIKFGYDNFKLDSLIGYFADYLKKDRTRLENYKREASAFIPNYYNGNYEDHSIDFFAKKYLQERYRRQRDEYFYLKNLCNYEILTEQMPRNRHKQHNVEDIDRKTRKKFFSIIELFYIERSKYFEKIDKFTLDEFNDLAKCLILMSPTEEDKEEFEKISKFSIEELKQIYNSKTKSGRR